jgi:hypothetical protein
MATSKTMGLFIIVFILIFTYPAFNDQVIEIGEHENATALETTIMNYFPHIWLMFIFVAGAVAIVSTVGKL